MDVDQQDIERNEIVPIREQPVKYIRDFDRNEFEKCRNYFSRPNELLRAMYRSWLDVQHQPEKCMIACRFCKTYFEAGWRPD